MKWRNAIGTAAFLLALALTVAGCGGNGDAAEITTEGNLTKAQYLKQASQVCELGNSEATSKYGQWEKSHTVDGKRPPESARDIALSRIALEAKTKELERLKELGLPRESEGFVPRIYEAWEEGIENAEERPASMRESLERYAFRWASILSIDYGLADCWLD